MLRLLRKDIYSPAWQASNQTHLFLRQGELVALVSKAMDFEIQTVNPLLHFGDAGLPLG